MANNEFAARAAGGYRFRTNAALTTGCNLPAGSGVFSCSSSRDVKENFKPVSGEQILRKLRSVPVSSWNYIPDPVKAKHIGPMAQDFYKAFGTGTSNTEIGLLDANGIAIAAAQALDKRTQDLQAQLEAKDRRIRDLETRMAKIEELLAAKKR